MASELEPEVNAPALLDLTIDNITPNTIRINSQSPNARLTYLMARLVTHLHDFARETRLSTDEWMAAITFLIGCGQISNDVRNVRGYPRPSAPQRCLANNNNDNNNRNSSCSPMFLVSPSWSTTSTTLRPPTAPRARCLGPSTLMMPRYCPMAAV